jgi:DNA-binding LacI/PurR family transcriptional regulator
MGKAAAKLFIVMLHSKTDMSHQEVVLKPKLVIRESSSRMPAGTIK